MRKIFHIFMNNFKAAEVHSREKLIGIIKAKYEGAFTYLRYSRDYCGHC